MLPCLMLSMLALGTQVQKLHGKAGKESLGVKEKKGCDVRLSVSTDFGGYKEPLSAAPGKHRVQHSAVMSLQREA